MQEETYGHRPVMLDEVIAGLAIKASGIYVDATFGRGGHARAILDSLDERGRLLAIDQDPDAIAAAAGFSWTQDQRFELIKAAFTELTRIVGERDLYGKIQGILLDLGVSSPQLDDPARGFSFLHEGPLDMRMDNSTGITAAQWLAKVDQATLFRVFTDYGEESYASRIARAVIDARAVAPITTTTQLANIIAAASPTRERYKHPATRCFQAIRILINNELEELKQCLQQCYDVLAVGGRLVVISFHSLEDRIVKRFLHFVAQGSAPSDLPITDAEHRRAQRMLTITKAVKTGVAERDENPRARSAVLRVAEKIR